MHGCLGFLWNSGDLPAISVGYILQLQEGASWEGYEALTSGVDGSKLLNTDQYG